MNDISHLTVACYQGPPKSSPQEVLATIIAVSESMAYVDVLLFPETFLQGYFADAKQAKKNAIDLSSNDIFRTLSEVKPTIILGVNEIEQDQIFNTAVIIESGEIIGKSRKFSTYPPYEYFTLSKDFPIFEKNGIGYGICICCDINYEEPANILAKNGAQIIFTPMWNVIPRTHSLLPHMHNKAHLQAKAVNNKVWLVCSDIVYSDEDQVGIGASCIIDPNGEVVCQSQPLTENVLVYHIPKHSLDKKYFGLDRSKQEKFLSKYLR